MRQIVLGASIRPPPRAGIKQIAPTALSIDYASSNTPPQPPHNIPRHLVPIRLIQDFMPRCRVQLDRHIGHTRIPIPLPQLLNQYPACGQRVRVAGCDEDGQVAADAHEQRGVGQPGRWRKQRRNHVVRHVPAAPGVCDVGIDLCRVARQPFVAGAVFKACVECGKPGGRIGGGVGHGGGEQIEGGGA